MFKKYAEWKEWKRIRKQEAALIDNARTPPEPGFIPDFTKTVFSAPFAHHLTYKGFNEGTYIGWLGSFVTNKGKAETNVMDILEHYSTFHRVDTGDLGYHTCLICNSYKDRGEFIIDVGERIYYLPQMVKHYIIEHGYLPPSKFIEDVSQFWIDSRCKSRQCDGSEELLS